MQYAMLYIQSSENQAWQLATWLPITSALYRLHCLLSRTENELGPRLRKQTDPVATLQPELENHMQTNTTTGLRCLAAVAGVVFLSGTAVLIFGDVLKGAPITEKHYIAAVIIAGTMMVGHLSYEAWLPGKRLASIIFGFLFAIGTALVVLSSAGRQNETVSTTQAQSEAAEAARADARQGLKRAQAMLAEAQAALGRECKTGSGKRCAGIQRTIDVYEAAARGEQSKLDHIGPAKVVAPDEETFAEVVATIFGASKERVKATAVLAKPFLISLFLEFGAIVSFGFAFRGNTKTFAEAKWEASEKDRQQSSFDAAFLAPKGPNGEAALPKLPKPDAPKGPNGSRKMTRDEVLTDLMVRSATGRTFRSQEDAARHYGVSPSRYSEWSKAWESEGAIPARRMVGRCKTMSA